MTLLREGKRGVTFLLMLHYSLWAENHRQLWLSTNLTLEPDHGPQGTIIWLI